jgi:hypothetical protein
VEEAEEDEDEEDEDEDEVDNRDASTLQKVSEVIKRKCCNHIILKLFSRRKTY